MVSSVFIGLQPLPRPERLSALLADREPIVLVLSFVYGERMLRELAGNQVRGADRERLLLKWAKFTFSIS